LDFAQHYHHTFFTHFPIFWLSLFLISLLWLHLDKYRNQSPSFAIIFTLGGFIHMILDTIANPILWLIPIEYKPISLLGYIPSEIRGVPHWELFSELFVILWAFYLWSQKRRELR